MRRCDLLGIELCDLRLQMREPGRVPRTQDQVAGHEAAPKLQLSSQLAAIAAGEDPFRAGDQLQRLARIRL